MSKHITRNAIVAVTWALSLVVVGVVSGSAQYRPAESPQVRIYRESLKIISGDDIGFRIEGSRGATQIGRLVVRVNGRWVETEANTGVPARR